MVQREGNGYVARYPELDVVSEGKTIPEARENLKEAAEPLLETASPREIDDRPHSEVYPTPLEIDIG